MNNTSTGFAISAFQKRLWVLQQKGYTFTNQIGVSIKGDLDLNRLGKALEAVVSRHEILRTAYRQQPYFLLPLQVVQDAYQPATEAEEGPGGATREARMEAAFQEMLGEQGDPESGRPLQVKIVKLGTEDFFLILKLPALAADARSVRNLLGELSACYASGHSGTDPENAPLQFSQYSEWHNALLEEPDEESLQFW
ncbi:MAG: hypothetical protein ICV83_15060, partial [Cytophagales bacterium]|nr:hypothetical protein [Cytophagales bacterium]